MSSDEQARSAILKELDSAARQALKHSYSRYSGSPVGAAVRTSSGRVYAGCNVENSSFGATMCAERVAVFQALVDGQREITDIYVLTDRDSPWPPCGMCRQVISEFAVPDAMVFIANLQRVKHKVSFKELTPLAFTPEWLLAKR